MKIGLFFGSFNPIHTGHLIVANVILTESDLEQVWFVVSRQNPFKTEEELLPEQIRLQLVQSAIDGNEKLVASDVEFELPKPSYTIDTLRTLQSKYPADEFSLILGADNLISFDKWKEYQSIMEGHRILVYPRKDAGNEPDDVGFPGVELIEAPLITMSSTYIRDLVAQGKSIKYLVPDSVEEVIEEKGYYK